MKPDQAMPGDRIRIVNPICHKDMGKKFRVQKPNPDASDWIGNYAWVNGPYGPMCFFGREYEIIFNKKQKDEKADVEGQMFLIYQG